MVGSAVGDIYSAERILSSQTPIANERYTSSSTAIAGATQSHTRIESIQFLRFVAATIVVLYHSTVELGPHMAGDNQSALLRYTRIGAVGVHLFFVISGVIMVFTTYKGGRQMLSPGAFLLRRLIRIFPIYWLYCALYLVISSGPIDFGANLSALLLIPPFSAMIIGPGWTLSYELYFYFAFAIALSLRKLKLVLTSVALCFFASIGLRVLFFHPNNLSPLDVATNPLLIEFILGTWIGAMLVANRRLPCLLADAMTAVGICGLALWLIFDLGSLPSLITWGIPSALIVGGMAFREQRIGSFGLRRLSALGDSSYSLYLIHMLLLTLCVP
jgi:exopolysaccharide production protein ExoZ